MTFLDVYACSDNLYSYSLHITLQCWGIYSPINCLWFSADQFLTPSTQYTNCQLFKHPAPTCFTPTICQACTKPHPTTKHKTAASSAHIHHLYAITTHCTLTTVPTTLPALPRAKCRPVPRGSLITKCNKGFLCALCFVPKTSLSQVVCNWYYGQWIHAEREAADEFRWYLHSPGRFNKYSIV